MRLIMRNNLPECYIRDKRNPNQWNKAEYIFSDVIDGGERMNYVLHGGTMSAHGNGNFQFEVKVGEGVV